MGRAKHEWMEAEERGWTAPDKYVCRTCVEDGFLKTLIFRNRTATRCDYCNGKGMAAPVECLMDAISYGLHNEYNDFDSAGCPYGKEMPEIPADLTVDALTSIPLECNEQLLIDIADAFHNNQWVSAPGGWWAGSHAHDDLRWSWEGFARTVKHKTRFHFGNNKDQASLGHREIAVGDFLPMLGQLFARRKLFKPLSEKTRLYRVRLREHGASWEMDAEQLGAPPAEITRAGRMNPAGISYLYTALSSSTAVAETVSRPPQSVAIATFAVSEQLTVLDLSKLPNEPSPFDAANRSVRDELIFLHRFVDDIKQPVQKDGSEHIDYVPTQVICEYFAQAYSLTTNEGTRIAGIKYPSAVHPGHSNLVFFPRTENYRDPFIHVVFEGAKELSFATWSDLTDYFIHY
jgi:RES domain-containing protein